MKRRSILNKTEVLQEIEKSKFITYLVPVKDETEAKEALNEIKKIHPKATHHCSAMVIGDIVRSNDDGEPASSAGMPMLQVLQGNNMDNVLAVVVRYFGGTLLGVGGLIRAYSSSVTQAIEASEIITPQTVLEYDIYFPYDKINEVEHFFQSKGEILDRLYQENVMYKVAVVDETIMNEIEDITKGLGYFNLVGKKEVWVKECQ